MHTIPALAPTRSAANDGAAPGRSSDRHHAFLGATAGSRLSHRIQLRYLRLMFVVVLVYTALQMLLRDVT